MTVPKKSVTFNSLATGKQAATRPPIPLLSEEETSKKTVDTMKFRLLSVPGKKVSPTYEVTLNKFKSRTPEEYIKAFDCFGSSVY
jgi:hypothetical protein